MSNTVPSHYTKLIGLNVAEILVKYLELEGVTKIFGIPGRTNEYVLKAITENSDQIDYILCRHETGAAYIADGLSRISGGLGVLLVTSGPGAINALSGSMNAQTSHSALLTITGEVAQKYFGMGYLQEGIGSKLNISNIYQNAVQYSAVISHKENFQIRMTQALRESLGTPHRASHISLPANISNEIFDEINFPVSPENYRPNVKVTDSVGIKRIFEKLITAKFPLLFIGNGCRFALKDTILLERFIAFTEKYGIPVLTSANGKGLYPETSAMSLRNYGIGNCLWGQHYLSAKNPDYDAILVLGSGLAQLATNNWSPDLIPNCDGPFMQIDIDQSVIGRSYAVQESVVSEISEALRQLCDLGDSYDSGLEAVIERKDFIKTIKERYSPYAEPSAINSKISPVHPAALVKVISDGLPDGGHIFVDAGNCVGWSLHYATINPPSQIHSALWMGPMGFGVCAVIGGKMAEPTSTCVGIVGDGSFLMHGTEISTAVVHGVGAIWIVLFDDDMAMVSQGMNYDFDSTRWANSYRIGNPDLVKFSEALGADAYKVTSIEELQVAYETAINNANLYQKPQVIVVNIDRSAIPPYYPPKVVNN